MNNMGATQHYSILFVARLEHICLPSKVVIKPIAFELGKVGVEYAIFLSLL